MADTQEGPNFEAARMFIAEAEQAKAAGDENRCRAACHMAKLALEISDTAPRFHLDHLKK